MRNTTQLLSAVLAALVVCSISPGTAGAGYHSDNPQNIVLLLADDMDWSDLPFMNPAIHWSTPGAPHTAADDREIEEGRIRAPDLNRSAARLLAEGLALGHDPLEENGGSRRVVPVDFSSSNADCATNQDCSTNMLYFTADTNSDNAYCTNPNSTAATCPPATDILQNHGGLRRLALQGVVMPRMYATSSRCAPSRAGLLTGRHHVRIGVAGNGANLKGRELTIAEYLKQGCKTSDTTHACYHTALFGKWHLGTVGKNSFVSPWAQGFDEYVGFAGGSRIYSSNHAMQCSPVQRPLSSSEQDTMAAVVHQPTSRFCQLDPASAPPCTSTRTDNDCPNGLGLVCGVTSGVCFDPKLGYDEKCTTNTDCSGLPGYARTCQEHWRYVGSRDWDACPDGESTANLECCTRSNNPSESSPPKTNLDGKAVGAYRFTGRKVKSNAVGGLSDVAFQFDGTDAASACNDDGSVFLEDRAPANFVMVDADQDTTTGAGGKESVQTCLYSERFLRDVAHNFLVRQAARGAATDAADGTKPERFFMMVAFHAAHFAHVAPKRTLAHYLTPDTLVPTKPDPDYWAIIEELDAAVGNIMQALDSESLMKNTLVLFTNDNGSPSAAYGIPTLRGQKTEVNEGGVRVGMLAYGPALGVCTDHWCLNPDGVVGDARTASTKQREVVLSGGQPAIGSHVDLLATIADAAGYDVSGASGFDSDGSPQVKVCSDADSSRVSVPCTIDGDCISPATCTNSRGIDGRSLLKVLTQPADPAAATPPPNVNSTERAQVFSSFPQSGEPSLTLSTRNGYAPGCDGDDDGSLSATEIASCSEPTHVCGYERAAFAPTGATAADAKLSGRVVKASSCTACTGTDMSSAPNAECNGKVCEVLGGVCFREDELDSTAKACMTDSPGETRPDEYCGLSWRQRCQGSNDCQSGPPREQCVQHVRVKCDSDALNAPDATCFAAAWKGSGSDDGVFVSNKIGEVFDLQSNPEEAEGRAATNVDTDKAELNCRTVTVPSGQQVDTAFSSLEGDLRRQLKCWKTCNAKPVVGSGSTASNADAFKCDDVYPETPPAGDLRCAP